MTTSCICHMKAGCSAQDWKWAWCETWNHILHQWLAATMFEQCHSVGPHSFKPRSLGPYPLSRIPLGRIPRGRILSGRIPLGRIPISRWPLSRVPFSRSSLIYIYVYLLYWLGYSSNVRALSKRLRVRVHVRAASDLRSFELRAFRPMSCILVLSRPLYFIVVDIVEVSRRSH